MQQMKLNLETQSNKNAFYLTFSANTPERQVIARFVERYGRQPERIFPANPSLIMAGPIPENANA